MAGAAWPRACVAARDAVAVASSHAQGRNVHEATRAMPIIGDGDTGYGNALNVKRTVRGYAAAGFAGACSQAASLAVRAWCLRVL